MAGCANLVSRPFSFFPPLPSSTGKALGTRMLLCHLFFGSSPVIVEDLNGVEFGGQHLKVDSFVLPSHPTPVFSCDPTTQTSERTNQIKYGFGVYLKHVPTLFEPMRASFYDPAY